MKLNDFGLFSLIAAASLLSACPADRRPEESAPPAEREPVGETVEESEVAPQAEAPAAPEPEVASPEATEPADDGPIGPPRVSSRQLVAGAGNLYGILRTSQGVIVVRFFEDEAPLAVANFVGLATGQVRYQHHETGNIERGRFYDGTIFHRVIPGFMIQAGDPTGTGRGGPGYQFADERQEIGFDRPGLLGMANAGPNTNGSQFFITEAPTPHLNGRHTIFGTVESGMDVVTTIARVQRGPMDRPAEPVVMETVEIVRATEPPSP